MLRSALDFVPQDNFYMLVAVDLWGKEYPEKRPHQQLWAFLFISCLPLLVGLTVSNEYKWLPEAGITAKIILLIVAVNALLCVIFSIRPLVRKFPCAGNNAILYSTGSLRTAFWAMITIIVLAVDGGDNARIILWISASLFVLVSAVSNLFMFTRVIDRIRAGKYVKEGQGFWDSGKAYDRIILMVKGGAGALLAVLVLGFLNDLNDSFSIIDVDFQPFINALVLAMFIAGMIVLNVIMAYNNAKQKVLEYCFKRFGNDLEAFAPYEGEYDDEEEMYDYEEDDESEE